MLQLQLSRRRGEFKLTISLEARGIIIRLLIIAFVPLREKCKTSAVERNKSTSPYYRHVIKRSCINNKKSEGTHTETLWFPYPSVS